MLRRIYRRLYNLIFPRKYLMTFSEHPTRPLDADSLARALAGEGRRHVSLGCARYRCSRKEGSQESLYSLVGNSDGLNTLPDFGVVGVADVGHGQPQTTDVAHSALSAFSNEIIRRAVLDLLEVEGFEHASPLQNTVLEAFDAAQVAVEQLGSNGDFSLTAGLMFAEIIILGHRGTTRAYHIDRHHIERITTDGWSRSSQEAGWTTLEGVEDVLPGIENPALSESSPVTVYSRPVPRDGFILLCSDGLWKNAEDRIIGEIVMECEEPQEGCEALIAKVAQSELNEDVSVVLMHFPPDFGSWR
jgi:serine/threonine protein phosphatase PrpC